MIRYLLLLALTTFTFSSLAAQAWQNKIPASLEADIAEEGKAEFFVLMNNALEQKRPTHHMTKEEKGQWQYDYLLRNAELSQQDIIKWMEENEIGYQSFFLVNGLLCYGDMELVRKLAARSDVRLLATNPEIPLQEPIRDYDNASRETIEWGIQKIKADSVWMMGYKGEGVVVAGADTGVEWQHPAIASKYRGYLDDGALDNNYNWHDAAHDISLLHNDSIIAPSNNPCGLSVTTPCDDHNHGTHTVGTMVGYDGEDNQIGVAPDAKWIACRNMERGWGKPSTYIECFEWFLAPTDTTDMNPNTAMAPHVINNSWGCPTVEGCDSSNWVLLETATLNLKNAGIVVVSSAGNDGPGCNTVQNPTAMFEAAFSVGATMPDDTIARFSSRGAVSVDGSFRLKPNVSAPGTQIRSCVRNGGYASWQGTSMAGPHVAGAVALMINANPDMAGDVEIIEDILEATAKPMLSDQSCDGFSGLEVPNATYGYGRIDVYEAVKMAKEVIYVSNEEVLALDNIKIFPNPVDDLLTLECADCSEDSIIEIYHADGKKVFSLKNVLSVNNISTTQWTSGIYVVKINDREKSRSVKVIKM